MMLLYTCFGLPLACLLACSLALPPCYHKVLLHEHQYTWVCTINSQSGYVLRILEGLFGSYPGNAKNGGEGGERGEAESGTQ